MVVGVCVYKTELAAVEGAPYVFLVHVSLELLVLREMLAHLCTDMRVHVCIGVSVLASRNVNVDPAVTGVCAVCVWTRP